MRTLINWIIDKTRRRWRVRKDRFGGIEIYRGRFGLTLDEYTERFKKLAEMECPQ